jgi:hypothetical protein
MPNQDRELAIGIVAFFCLVRTAGEERLVETGGPHRVGSDKPIDLDW